MSSTSEHRPPGWLPPGKTAAICLSIDDVHPGTSGDPYEAGGDLGAGALGQLEWLLERQPNLRPTLFVTADWREISAVPTRHLLKRIPWIRDRLYLAKRHPKGRMRLDRHPEFARYLSQLPRTEIGLHGLHHCHPGLRIATEFQRQSRAECARMLSEALAIFEAAGLPRPLGMCPPAFNAPRQLLEAMTQIGFGYIASVRDIRTPIEPGATNHMSGLPGLSILEPELLPGGLVQIPVNFQATSRPERAIQILELGGLLHIKVHVIKDALGFIALDGLDPLYANYLDMLLTHLEHRFGAALWWTNMESVTRRVLEATTKPGRRGR